MKKFQWNTYGFFKGNAFENIICKISVIYHNMLILLGELYGLIYIDHHTIRACLAKRSLTWANTYRYVNGGTMWRQTTLQTSRHQQAHRPKCKTKSFAMGLDVVDMIASLMLPKTSVNIYHPR